MFTVWPATMVNTLISSSIFLEMVKFSTQSMYCKYRQIYFFLSEMFLFPCGIALAKPFTLVSHEFKFGLTGENKLIYFIFLWVK